MPPSLSFLTHVRLLRRRRIYAIPRSVSLLLVIVMAACQDTTAPIDRRALTPVFSQGADGVWTVTTLDDTPPGDINCTDASCTLRQALGIAANGDRIVFAAELNGSVQLANGIWS